MAKRLLLLLTVVALLAVIGGPGLYTRYLEGAPDAELSLPNERHPATTGIDGVWVVEAGPGEQAQRSQVGYRADQRLLWETLTVNGRTNGVSGRVIVAGNTLQSADFVVDVASMRSAHRGRDKKFRGTDVMDADRFPTAQLAVSEQVDLSGASTDGAPTSVEVPAELTLKGASRQVAVQLQVQRTGDRVLAVGQTSVAFADFGVDPPMPFLGLLQVQPVATVEFLLTLVKQ